MVTLRSRSFSPPDELISDGVMKPPTVMVSAAFLSAESEAEKLWFFNGTDNGEISGRVGLESLSLSSDLDIPACSSLLCCLPIGIGLCERFLAATLLATSVEGPQQVLGAHMSGGHSSIHSSLDFIEEIAVDTV